MSKRTQKLTNDLTHLLSIAGLTDGQASQFIECVKMLIKDATAEALEEVLDQMVQTDGGAVSRE